MMILYPGALQNPSLCSDFIPLRIADRASQLVVIAIWIHSSISTYGDRGNEEGGC